MPSVNLFPHQKLALQKMHNGCILCGGTGSGKSITGIAYYFLRNGGNLESCDIPGGEPKDLYIITTARKRDTAEWEGDLRYFLLTPNKESAKYKHKLIIDSWNNIKKYRDIKDAFFIFDEQRLIGNGVWVDAFYDIAKSNEWILLSATPGDTWTDYIPVFIANGYYRNKTEFISEHVIYSRFSKYPKVDRYVNTGRLIRLRDRLLVHMDFLRSTVQHHEDIYVSYDRELYRKVMKERWDFFKNEPIRTAGSLCYILRKIVNSDPSRLVKTVELVNKHRKAIIFYNFDYELELLKSVDYGADCEVAEWNGHKHQPIPDGEHWVYLCQYTATCEGWNCITTNAVVFFSQNYSYRTQTQASGRIDRLNTKFIDLWYYHLKSSSQIDIAISRALNGKKEFNEGKFYYSFEPKYTHVTA